MTTVHLAKHYYSPEELGQRVAEWVDYYNHQRYHESLDNVTPADMYWGRYEQILAQRQKIKRLTMAQRRKKRSAAAAYLPEITKGLKTSLLFLPLSVHFWLTIYINMLKILFLTLLLLRRGWRWIAHRRHTCLCFTLVVADDFYFTFG